MPASPRPRGRGVSSSARRTTTATTSLVFFLATIAAAVAATLTHKASAQEYERPSNANEYEYETTDNYVDPYNNQTDDYYTSPDALWPPYNPQKPPLFDVMCFGKAQDKCRKAGPYCRWHTDQGIGCYDRRFYSVRTAPQNRANVIPYHVKFFSFSYGIHLVEGTFNKIFYNMDVEACAVECLKSAATHSGGGAAIRCMSFDFYPFEVPITDAPYYESADRGICQLNSELGNSARLRNEDEGFTPAELYYKSHHTTRPFHPLGGYYEVRDPRGNDLATMLAYAGESMFTQYGLQTPWGGSRWGIFHPTKFLPPPIDEVLVCNSATGSDEPPLPYFMGGFTPLTDEQHCPGAMTKSEASLLCASRGGGLCANRTVIDTIGGRKLGCSYDNTVVWHDAIPDRGQLLFPRCCARYAMPISPLVGDACSSFSQQAINYCGGFKNVMDCALQGANIGRRVQLGFGKQLDIYRQVNCKASGAQSCQNLLVSANWVTSTTCVWCVAPGNDVRGGNGVCRPGSSYGICPTASDVERRIFGLQARSVCSADVNCNLINKFPDLKPFIANRGVVDAGGSVAPTSTRPPTSPSNQPITLRPTTKVTMDPLPTKQPPSPTPKPPSPNPTPKPPTSKPTKKPTTKAKTTDSPTRKPTDAPVSSDDAPCSATTMVSMCVDRYPKCKWSVVQGQCVEIVDDSKPVRLACSFGKTRPSCLARADTDGCMWVVKNTGYGSCVRSPDWRGATFSPTLAPSTSTPTMPDCGTFSVKGQCTRTPGCVWVYAGMNKGWRCTSA